MARINTNISSMIAQHNLARSNSDLSLRLERLSTGLRINKGADDPAGLIVSERLRNELGGLNKAVENSERATMVIATTEGYLAEVADLLTSIQGLVVQAANTGGVSDEEINANQLQIDNALDAITRISNTASFAGLQLLNGSLDYLTSGVATSAIAGATIHAAQFGANDNINVQVEVLGSAQTASLFLSGNTSGAAGSLLSSVTIEIAGVEGVQTLSFVSGTALSAVVQAVNVVADTTGISAALVSGGNQTSGLTFNSREYGSDAFVSVKKVGSGGDFFSTHVAQGGAQTQRDEGRDVTAIINGTLAAGDGLNVSLNTPSLAMDLLLDETFAQTVPGSASTFDITGGGSVFQLGPTITSVQQVALGIPSVAASRLGGVEDGGVLQFLESIRAGKDNSLKGSNLPVTSKIVESAIDQVALLRGRLGAFERNTLQTNIRTLQVGVENISASESRIRDADFAAETAHLTRAQILSQAGTSVLATANNSSQNVLALLQ